MSASPPRTSPSAGRTRTFEASDPIFDQAMARFTKEHKDIFAQCTKNDVAREIKRIQDSHGAQRRLRDMQRLSKFVEGMAQLSRVVEVFLNCHNGVAFIWGPIKFILVTASTWIDSLDSLLEVYGQIGEALPDLTRYAEVYQKYPSVRAHLEAYYYDILDFHKNALEVFSRPGWKNFFRSAWKTFRTHFEPILKSLERHRVMLSEEKLTAVMEETQKRGQSIEDKFDSFAKDWKERVRKDAERDLAAHRDYLSQQRRIVKGKIDAPDYHDDHEFASQKRHQSTSGNWILSHPLLLEWFEPSNTVNRKIYLSGIPGAGKTVLTSHLISHLKQRQLNSSDSAKKFSVAYFYFKDLQREKRSMVSLLLALLSQLIDQDENLLDHVYQSCCTIDQQRLRSLDAVSDLVSMALQSQSLCFVVVDGLDECPEASKILLWFENLMSSRENDLSGSREPSIRLFISGQRDGVLEDQMSEYPSIQLETTEEHDKDIEAFTTTMAGKIREKFSLDSEVEQEILSRITSRARGMFLYAQLVVGNLLSQTSKYDLKQELKAETFPEGLSQAYERVIVRVLRNRNKAERDAAKQILGMIMCACRPLYWREIQSKFCIDVSKGEANLDRQLLITCKQLCGSLVEISCLKSSFTSCEEVVDLVHSTVKTYLDRTEEISLATENAKMTLFCAEYLLSRPLTPGISKREIQHHATKGYYGFQDYAVAFWWQHAQHVLTAPGREMELNQRALQAAHRAIIDIGELEQDNGSNESPEDIQFLKNKFEHIPQNLRDWKSIGICEMRTVAIREAINSLLSQPDNTGDSVPVLPLYGQWRYKCPKPWCQFFSSGFEEPQHQQAHIKQHDLPFLCDFQGCYATEVGFCTETELKRHNQRWHSTEKQPLFRGPKYPTSRNSIIVKAAERGDLDTIKDLVENGINIRDQKWQARRSPLHVATENGHLHVCLYLTRMGVDPNGKTKELETPLHKSVARRDLEITRFFCGQDSVSLSKDVCGKTALDYAVCEDPFDKAIIRQLLRKATPNIMRDALLLAIRSKLVMVVRYLAENIDAHNYNAFETALEVAVETGHLPCLEALLSSGKANPNARTSKGTLPFHVACVSGNLPAVQRLHALTAATDLKDATGNWPLHLAIANGQEAVVRFLVEKGAGVNVRDSSGQTPLLLALRNGHEALARLFVEKEADVNAGDSNGQTPLFWAVKNDHDALARLFVEKGADVNVRDSSGQTPLFWALENGHDALAGLFVENGADVNAGDSNGQTPLFWALENDHDALARLFVEKEADVNAGDSNGQTPLFWAVKNDHDALARLFVEKGADVNAGDSNGQAPLLWASRNGQEAVVRFLVEKGADVNVRDSSGQTPLLLALRNGHEALVRFLVEKGADVNVRDSSGQTPLLLALENGYDALAGLFIEKGANVNAGDIDGQTPLSLALSNGHDTVTRQLVEKGADVNVRDSSGQTPLLLALRNGHEALVRFLVEKGADVNVRDSSGQTPLLLALENGYDALAGLFIEKGANVNAGDIDGQTPLSLALSNGHDTVTRQLVEKGADVNAGNTSGQTPLLWASRNGHEALVRLLFDNRAGIEARDIDGQTPLLCASRNGHQAVMKFLLHNGADIEAGDNDRQTPLSWASRNGYQAVTRSLLEDGADIEASDNDGQTPLSWALRNGHKAVARLLFDNGASIESKDVDGQTPLSWASRNGHQAVTRFLLHNGADIKASDNDGQTPLSWASRNGHQAVGRLLFDNGASIEARDNNGQTPLSWASRNGHEAVARLLFDNGASIESKDVDGQTPLSWASRNGHEAVARLLFENGASINARDIDEQTPLSWASRNGHEAVARLLFDNGASIESKDVDGQTPLSWASRNGHEAVARLLFENGASINARDIDEQTPLSWASRNGHEAVARLLFDNGASIESKDIDGQTPLSWASRNGHQAVARFLLHNRANIETRDNDGQTPLSWASRNGHKAVARLLFDNGASIETKDVNGQTPLSWALKNGHQAVTLFLLHNRADNETPM